MIRSFYQITLCILIAITATGLSGTASAKTLSATIEHKKVLPAVPPELQAGATFDEQNIPVATASKWFKIPSWFAGSWMRTRVKKKVLGMVAASVADKRVRHFGPQVDKDGQIWHWVQIPGRIVSERFDTVSYFLSRDEDSEILEDQDAIKIRTTWTAWTVSKRSKRIIKVEQGDQIDIFKQKADNKLRADSYVQYYNQEGKRVASQKAYWDENRVEVFRPINYAEGIDVRRLFIDYMIANGMADRINSD